MVSLRYVFISPSRFILVSVVGHDRARAAKWEVRHFAVFLREEGINA